MIEKWKSIPNYEGIYEASSLGRIRTCEGKTTIRNLDMVIRWKSRILKGRGHPSLGFRVSLCKNKTHKDWLVARIVAMTFYGMPEENMTVNHKDGNRFNNSIENLEWLTIGDNIRHGFKNNLYPQTSINLKSELGEVMNFKSLAEGSRYLGRNVGYLHSCLTKNRIPTTCDGYTFTIV